MPKPMKATPANVTCVLKAAGYSKWWYRGMELTPGPSVERGIDAKTGKPVLFVIHRISFGCLSQSSEFALSDKSPGFYQSAYARALRERFAVSNRIVKQGKREGKAWVIEPLDTDTAGGQGNG